MNERGEMIEKRIRDAVKRLTTQESFKAWLLENAGEAGDYIFFNNSFVFRDRVKTRKNALYLGAKIGTKGRIELDSICVGEPPGFNVDFKRFSAKSQNMPAPKLLRQAMKDQIANIGQLVFILIGGIDNTVGCEVPVDHSLFSNLRFDPKAQALVEVQSGTITTRTLDDSEAVWVALQEIAIAQAVVETSLPDSLESPFAQAFEILQNEAYSRVKLPTSTVSTAKNTLLGELTATLSKQIDEYNRSLEECGNDPRQRPDALNNVLRIAYNFATEAAKLVELIVSICDLKPVVAWCTNAEHHELALRFRNLPWARSKAKPSMPRYEQIIAGARNRAFHSLVPFERSLEVDVANLSLRARRLRLFSSYSKRTGNLLEYEDQELVQVLTEFTRAPETAVSVDFWRRNGEVMRSFEGLLTSTTQTLIALRRATV